MDSALRWMWIVAVVSTAVPEVFAKDLVFSGSLEKVTPEAISIRLADGIIIEALLPQSGSLSGESLSYRRFVGDPVEITCATISPTYDARAELFRHLELIALRPSQVRPMPDDLAKLFNHACGKNQEIY